jgi:MFS family permease
MAVVLLSFVVIGIALPVLPLHVHDELGFGPSVVGLVAGGQFIAALVSRFWAGSLSDTRGPKTAVVLGLVAAILGGALYLLSLQVISMPVVSVSLLLVGRTLLGGAESFVITGAMSWGLGLLDSANSGKVIARVGMSMFAALAVGAPVGTMIFAAFGFAGIALATAILPLAALLMILPMRGTDIRATDKPPVRKVLGAVLMPGFGFALSGITFGAMTAFLPVLFAERGWASGAFAFTSFPIALIGARTVFGHLPDRFGGARVAIWSLVVQALGQGLIWFAPWEPLAFVGAVVSGLGFALVYPGLGIEAVRSVPPENRGLAMGTYTAFLDVTLGLGSPVLGFLASIAGLGAVFLASGVTALCAVPVAIALMTSSAARARTSSELQEE